MAASALDILRQLVAIDSTSNRSNAPIIEVLSAHLVARGFAVTQQSYTDENGLAKHNLIGRRGGEGTAELALVGHSDCVPFDPAWKEALNPTERDGRLYGRGSCDTKGFIAAALAAADRTQNKHSKPLLLTFTADEEIGCIGAKKLLDTRALQVKRAIIGEPTSLTPIRANKGYCLAEVEVLGKEGHSAYPDTGASAIFRGARLIAKLENYARGELRADVHHDFIPPFTTLNVGMVSGGKAKNIIPGHLRLTLEWRPLPTQPVDAVLKRVQQLIDECRAEDEGFTAHISDPRLDRGFDTDAGADVVKFLEAESGNATQTVPFGTEGPQLAALGAVPVVFGPGDITVAHQTGEYVPLNELQRCSEILEAAIVHFCR